MFDIRINLRAEIDGCPSNGVGAVDFRRRVGLADGATNQIQIELEGHDESICRQLAEYLGPDADLILDNSSIYAKDGSSDRANDLFRDPGDLGLVRVALSPEAIRSADPVRIVRELERRKAERWERRAAEIAERQREEAGRKAAEQARREEEEAKKRAGSDRLKRWAEENGSELLRARIADGFEWAKLAEAEYGAHAMDRLGYEQCPDAPDGYEWAKTEDRDTPTLDEIRALRGVRDAIRSLEIPATAELAWVKYNPAEDEDGYRDEDLEAFGRTEIIVTITLPTGAEREYFVLPSAVVGRD